MQMQLVRGTVGLFLCECGWHEANISFIQYCGMESLSLPVICQLLCAAIYTPRAKIINVFRAWIGAQLTICAQK